MWYALAAMRRWKHLTRSATRLGVPVLVVLLVGLHLTLAHGVHPLSVWAGPAASTEAAVTFQHSEWPSHQAEARDRRGEMPCPAPDLRPQPESLSLAALPVDSLAAYALPHRQGVPAGTPAIRPIGPARQALLQRFLL